MSFAVGAALLAAADFVAAVTAGLAAGLVGFAAAAGFGTAAAGELEAAVAVSSLVTSGVAFSLSFAIFFPSIVS
ncbi:MAG: hypothetical protein JNK80_06905 [Dechloromonas sp.]|nr:hypothetical protein [Dechloromonas sp.]